MVQSKHFKSMKNYIIGLIALAVVLGASCKKEQVEPVKQEIKVKEVVAIIPGGEVGYPSGANTYPHNTGICYCGQYSVCHPTGPSHRAGCTGYRSSPAAPGGDVLCTGCK